MRNLLSSTALGLALAAGASAAQAQAVVTRQITDQPVETVITQQPGSMIVAEQPVVTVPAPVATAPSETVETVRTVRTTTRPRRRVIHHTADRVTTTRTIVRRQIVPAAPALAAIAEPTYTAAAPPPGALAPAPRLYDVVTPAPVAAPATVVPSYRYVYEPDRILVIDPYTNIAVQSIPR